MSGCHEVISCNTHVSNFHPNYSRGCAILFHINDALSSDSLCDYIFPDVETLCPFALAHSAKQLLYAWRAPLPKSPIGMEGVVGGPAPGIFRAAVSAPARNIYIYVYFPLPSANFH